MKRFFLLILLGINLGIHADAQSIDFYNSFADDQCKFDPELLMFEPHYNADGTISHYSIANILKIEYERNEEGQPIRKTMLTLDKYDYDWDKLFVTDYEYKTEGLLVRFLPLIREQGQI